MNETAERLADSLLFEGYALYPYTAGAVKNATPTPFGIVYPPAYAAQRTTTFDHVQIECVALTRAAARVEVATVFLQASGSRHAAVRRRVELAATVAELVSAPRSVSFAFEPEAELGVTTGERLEAGGEVVGGRLVVSADPLEDGSYRIRARAENETPLPHAVAGEMDRAAALRCSLLSTHVLIGIAGGSEAGRFVSPLENDGEVGARVQACENVNSWPVLAAADDSAVLGAAILLPDHPRIAAQSNANMFDNTEIEEALTLHVQVLSDAERAEIEAAGDPAVTEMIERVEATTPEELLSMHGVMGPTAPERSEPDFPEWREPGVAADPGAERSQPPTGFDPADVPGERSVVVAGRRFERGGKVVLRPGTDGDPYDKMLDGQPATIRRIYLDYDGRAYLGVTVDADPMSEILRDAGRYLFFFADEVEEA